VQGDRANENSNESDTDDQSTALDKLSELVTKGRKIFALCFIETGMRYIVAFTMFALKINLQLKFY